VVLNGVAQEALRSIKRDRKIASPYVFAWPQGKSLRNNFDKRYWRPAPREAKIPDFRFHDLRHTFASRLVAAGFIPSSSRRPGAGATSGCCNATCTTIPI